MGCRGVWHVLGIRGVQGSIWYDRGEMKTTHMGIFTNEVVHAPPLL